VRTVIATAIAVVLALALAGTSLARTARSAHAATLTEAETGPLVEQQLARLRTTDGIRLKEALCKPANDFSVEHGLIFSSSWYCTVTDALNRAYALNTHVRNTNAGGLDSLNVTYCWRAPHFKCPGGANIVLPG
jgi:hypothetical protein